MELLPRVFNLHNRATPMLPNGRYIGRGSPYGNPFIIGRDGTRDEVCNQFELVILPKLDVEPLRGRNLYCYCSPQRCHGHSIFKKLYGIDYQV